VSRRKNVPKDQDYKRSLKDMCKIGHAKCFGDGTYELTQLGKDFYRARGISPFSHPDANQILIPIEVFEVLFIFFEGVVERGARPEEFLTAYAIRHDFERGKTYQLLHALNEFLAKLKSLPFELHIGAPNADRK
jgi:hypothetical protein